MKFTTAVVAAAVALTMAPLPSQAFFLNEKALNYKLHIVECLGLLFSERHAAECGGVVTGPFNSLSSPGSPSGPAAAPAPAKEDDDKCYQAGSLVEDLAVGDRVRVAVNDYGCYEGPVYEGPAT